MLLKKVTFVVGPEAIHTAHVVLGISLMSALLLAAVLSPTDPATLVPIFLSVHIKDKPSADSAQ